MILGGSVALIDYSLSIVHVVDRSDAYRQLRQRLGRAILLGLEVLIIGDIVRTIIVDPTVESVAVLGMIVIIRIALSFSLEVEIDGVWPWSLCDWTRTLTVIKVPIGNGKRRATNRIIEISVDRCSFRSCIKSGFPGPGA